MELSGAVAFVSGGASGLGAATARLLVKGGARVGVFDRSGETAEALARELNASGDSAIAVPGDVSNEADVKGALDALVAKFGPVTIAVNCAGIGTVGKVLGKEGPHSAELFERTLRVNLLGTFNVIRLSAAQMQNNTPNAGGERGVIVNTASVAAFDGQIGQAAYTASKGGVAAMTLPVARELARFGIRVMTIAPGIFDTPMLAGLPDDARKSLGQQVPFPSRLGDPSEYALLVEQIVRNPMLNGTTIRLDGALRMAPK
jgi:NAD(P)-dependent dehydrogenase (short-subunit alcohol dehydrogenase family)